MIYFVQNRYSAAVHSFRWSTHIARGLSANACMHVCLSVCKCKVRQFWSRNSGATCVYVHVCRSVAVCPRQCPYWPGILIYMPAPRRFSTVQHASLLSTAWPDLWPSAWRIYALKLTHWLQSQQQRQQHWTSSHYPYWLFFSSFHFSARGQVKPTLFTLSRIISH